MFPAQGLAWTVGKPQQVTETLYLVIAAVWLTMSVYVSAHHRCTLLGTMLARCTRRQSVQGYCPLQGSPLIMCSAWLCLCGQAQAKTFGCCKGLRSLQCSMIRSRNRWALFGYLLFGCSIVFWKWLIVFLLALNDLMWTIMFAFIQMCPHHTAGTQNVVVLLLNS